MEASDWILFRSRTRLPRILAASPLPSDKGAFCDLPPLADHSLVDLWASRFIEGMTARREGR
jgi:hypothetical protein